MPNWFAAEIKIVVLEGFPWKIYPFPKNWRLALPLLLYCLVWWWPVSSCSAWNRLQILWTASIRDRIKPWPLRKIWIKPSTRSRNICWCIWQPRIRTPLSGISPNWEDWILPCSPTLPSWETISPYRRIRISWICWPPTQPPWKSWVISCRTCTPGEKWNPQKSCTTPILLRLPTHPKLSLPHSAPPPNPQRTNFISALPKQKSKPTRSSLFSAQPYLFLSFWSASILSASLPNRSNRSRPPCSASLRASWISTFPTPQRMSWEFWRRGCAPYPQISRPTLTISHMCLAPFPRATWPWLSMSITKTTLRRSKRLWSLFWIPWTAPFRRFRLPPARFLPEPSRYP